MSCFCLIPNGSFCVLPHSTGDNSLKKWFTATLMTSLLDALQSTPQCLAVFISLLCAGSLRRQCASKGRGQIKGKKPKTWFLPGGDLLVILLACYESTCPPGRVRVTANQYNTVSDHLHHMMKHIDRNGRPPLPRMQWPHSQHLRGQWMVWWKWPSFDQCVSALCHHQNDKLIFFRGMEFHPSSRLE